ncbi:MAG: O-antigen ligase family protein [Spirochaetia bacterium]|nr:O-antigen ligase family protein [Spirochaetia bacterium]
MFYSIAAAAARPRLILLPAAAVILAIPAMIISSSRGPIVALTGAAAVFTILLYVRPVSAGFLRGAITLVIASSALFCLFCLVPSFNNELRSTADRFRLAAAPSSADVSRRACFALTGARIFSESPLSGCGPGCIKKHFQSAQAGILSTGGGCVFSSTSYLHNDYLQTACDTGAAGLLLLLLFIFSIPFSRGFVRSIKTGKGYTERVCYFSVIIFYMIESFFNFPLFSFPSAPLFFAAAGLASRDENNGKRHKIPSNLVTAAVLLTPVVVFFAAVKPNAFAADFYYKAALSGSAPVELSEKYYRKSCALENDNFDVLRSYAGFLAAAGRYEDAIVVYRRLLDIFPYSADALFNSAVCLQRAGKTREAFVYYNKTLYLNPQLLQARYELRSMDGPGRGSPDRTSPSIQDPGVNENGATGSQRMLLFMESGTP